MTADSHARSLRRNVSPALREEVGARLAAGAPTRANARTKPAPIGSLHDLMAHAYAMEIEASQRYDEFADAMETHNNPALAAVFRKLARIENGHAERILVVMHWSSAPVPSSGRYQWQGLEAPETGDSGALHYLMQPFHALRIARANEERAWLFFADAARRAPSTALRKTAREFEAEEAEHMRLIDEWLTRVPEPAEDWAHDADPPAAGS